MTLFGNRDALKKVKLNKVAISSNLVKGNDDVIAKFAHLLRQEGNLLRH